MDRQPTAISAFDLPGAHQLLIHSCEDCACPVSTAGAHRAGRSPLADLPLAAPLSSAPGVFESALDREHTILFRPVGPGGAVVVNEPGCQVFRQFARPVTLNAVRARTRFEAGAVEAVAERLWRTGVIHRPGQPPKPSFEPSKTLTAWLHVTNSCNLACPYCYVSKSPAGMDERTGLATVDSILDSASAHGFTSVKLKYAGGEASLNRDLVLTLDAYAREQAEARGLGLQATLLSNGVSLPTAFTRILQEAGVGLMISLDGIGQAHDAQRPSVGGQPSFRLVARTIARLLEQGYPPHISVTITDQNAGGVADVVRFALDRNLTFSLNFFRDNECSAGAEGLRYSSESMISGMVEAFDVIRDRLPSWSVLGSILDRGQLLEPRQRPCGVGQDYVVIDQDGGVAQCHMEIERTIGDVFHDDPVRLVREDGRTSLNLAVDEKEGCRDCQWRYWCSGGCPAATFRATGRSDVKSPNCDIYRAIYPEALRLEGLRLLKYGAC